MSDELSEQGELTDRFQAFAQSVDPPASRTLPTALIVSAVVVALIVVVWVVVAG